MTKGGRFSRRESPPFFISPEKNRKKMLRKKTLKAAENKVRKFSENLAE